MKRFTGFARHSLPWIGCAAAILVSALLTLNIEARAETIAISLPISGDAAELGRNFRTGAKLAVEKLEIPHDLFIADDGCDPDLAGLAAKDIAERKAAIVIGLLCNEPAKIIAGELVGSDIPVLVSGARSTRLIKDREREEWNLWRLSPGDDYPVEVAAQAIARLWQSMPYAIIDDGTIYGRSFTDGLRIKMRDRGLEPQFSDNFRAAQSTQAGLLRRLQRSGVAAAFIASSTTEDLFTIINDANRLGIDIDIMTTEALGVLPFLEEAELIPPGVKIVASAFNPEQTIEQLLAERDIRPDIHHYMGFASMQIARQILSDEDRETRSDLSGKRFDTVLGTIRFADDGSADLNPYQLLVWDGENLVKHSGN